MLNIEKNIQVNFKTNDEWLASAKEVFARKGLDVTAALNLFIHEVMVTQDIPFQTVEDKERERLIAELGKQIDKNLADIGSGKGMAIEEVEEQLIGEKILSDYSKLFI